MRPAPWRRYPPRPQPAAASQTIAPGPETPGVTEAPPPAVLAKKKRISERKLAANRANAKLSTGPKTPEGKSTSKLNATKHGLTSRYFPGLIQAGTQEWQESEAIRKSLFDHYQPIGPIEELLLEKITIEYVRYRRLVEREKLLCDHNRGYFLEIVDKLTRYDVAINRQLYEAMRELERVQTNRKAKEPERVEEKGEQNGERECSSD